LSILTKKKITSILSSVILTVFLTTHTIYGAERLSLRVPQNLDSERLKRRLLSLVGVTCDNKGAFSRIHAEVKQEQENIQKETESQLEDLHDDVVGAAEHGQVSLMGAISAHEIKALEDLVDSWVEQEEYDHIVFITEQDHALAETLLQALTKTSKWNKEMMKKKRPQIHFVDSKDPADIQRLMDQRQLAPGRKEAKIQLVNLGKNQDQAEQSRLINILKGSYDKKLDLHSSTQQTLTKDKLGLLVAGLVDKTHINEIYGGAKTAYDEWKKMDGKKASAYHAYAFAANQIRFAKTGQNVSIFTIFSKRLRGYSVWLAQQFNKEIGNADLPIWFSGEWATDHRHATAQAHSQSKGIGHTPDIAEKEDKGFIALSFLNPYEEIEDERFLVHGDANGQYTGYPVDFMLHVDRESQRLSSQQADRPIIDLDFMAETPGDLGRMLHFGQISSVMAGRLAGADSSKNNVYSLDRAIEKNASLGKTPDTIKDGTVKMEQNILTFEKGNKLSGVVGSAIQDALNKGDRKLFEFLVKETSKLIGQQSGLEKVMKAFQGGNELIHMDPEQTRKAIDPSEKMAQRFKKYERVYVTAIGGSTSGDYLLRMLNLTDGPEVIYITDYDDPRLKIAEEDIRKNPERIAVIEITKSGVTTEVDVNASAMIDTLKMTLRERGTEEDAINEHFLFITDPLLGDLREQVREQGYLSMDHPEHGGRFTMFSELGLFFYFLKGGDKQSLVNAVDDWASDMQRLFRLSRSIAKYREVLDLAEQKTDKERIEALNQVFKEISMVPGVWSGFLNTFINTIHQVAPELVRDTELAIAVNGNIRQMVSPDRPFYQQLKVESKGKAGVRFYAGLAGGVDSVRAAWDRIIANKKAYVTLCGETLPSANRNTEEEARIQATWDAMMQELSRHGVPVISMRTGPMNLWNLVETMQTIYQELAVSAVMYEPMEISSEGQPGVQLAKDVFRAILASVNNDIGEAIKVYRAELEKQTPKLEQEQIDIMVAERIKELRAEGRPIPKIHHEDIESMTDAPMDLKVSMNMDQGLADLTEKIIKNDATESPGLATLLVREKVKTIQKDEIVDYIKDNIMKVLSDETDIGKIIIDGEAHEVGDGTGNLVVRATTLDSPFNIMTGTASGTSLEIYRIKQGILEQEPLVSIKIQWGSSIRVIVSNGLRTQDYVLLDDSRLIEISKAEENNFMRMGKRGSFVSIGDESIARPDGFQAFEKEVILPSMKFKVRHSDSPTADMYLMMNKQGLMTGWMSWGEAIGLSQIMKAASGTIMIMTDKGLTHIKDIEITEELLESGEQVYVYAGVKNLIDQMQLWMNFLNIKDVALPAEEAVVFKVMDVLGEIPVGAPNTLKAEAIMLLLQLKEGLSEFPKSRLLKGQIREIVVLLREKVDDKLNQLDQAGVMTALEQEYLTLNAYERNEKADKYVLLGHPDALMRSKVKAGRETRLLYELEDKFIGMTSWDIMQQIKAELSIHAKYTYVVQSLDELTTSLQKNYIENSKKIEKKDKVSLPKTGFGENLQDYLDKNVRIRKEAKLNVEMTNEMLSQTKGVCDEIFEVYLNPVSLPKEEQDHEQREIISELKKKEPELFYESDGTTFIHSLEWIINNVRERKAGTEVNLSGDVSSRLDEIFNSVFKYVMRKRVHAIISEEDPEIVYGLGSKGKNDYRIVLFLDPIDGSSQVGHGGAFGSIFTIGFLRPGQELEDGSFDPRNQVITGFDLQYGWPSTLLTLLNPENKKGVPEVLQFTLTKGKQGKPVFLKESTYDNMMATEKGMQWDGLLPVPDGDPAKVIQLALGGALMDSIFEDGHKEFISWLIGKYGYQPAYTGALLNDERRLLMATLKSKDRSGVLYTYPRTGGQKYGRLRYPFEGIYYALIFQALGGEVIDGTQPLLNTEIQGDRPSEKQVPFYSGSAWITKLKMAWADYLTKNKLTEKTDEAMQIAWENFLGHYNQQARRLISEIVAYSKKQGDRPITEEEARWALLTWDSVDMEENNFSIFLDASGEEAYKKLFPQGSLRKKIKRSPAGVGT